MDQPKRVEDYRQRIYRYYNSARQHTLAPKDLDGLNPRAPYLRNLIRDHFPPAKTASILDLGCGYGALIYFAAQAGYTNINGVDGSPEQVAAANRLGIEGVQEGDLMVALRSKPSESLDTVIAFDLMEHFSKSELLELVDEIYRVLRPQGNLIVHVPNGESPFTSSIRYGDFTHETAFTRTSMTQLFLSSGYGDVKCFEDVPIPHGFNSSLRWLLWQVIRSGLRFYIAVETGDSSNEHVFSQNFLAVIRK